MTGSCHGRAPSSARTLGGSLYSAFRRMVVLVLRASTCAGVTLRGMQFDETTRRATSRRRYEAQSWLSVDDARVAVWFMLLARSGLDGLRMGGNPRTAQATMLP